MIELTQYIKKSAQAFLLISVLAACSGETKPVQSPSPTPSEQPAKIPKPIPTASHNWVPYVRPGSTPMPLPPGFERAFFDITNEDRVRNGLPKLSLSEALSRIAKQRSQEVLQPGNFSHYVAGTNQLRFAILLGEAKFPYSFAGENIEENNLVNLEKNLDYANQDFMNSPEHRENILNQRFTEVGVGVFGPDSNYRVAYAQIFAQVK